MISYRFSLGVGGDLDNQTMSLYSQPLPSLRTGLFYNTFPYPTKIAPESIAVFIATHTKPGDTVLDTFSGSGSTGLAALMCEHPTAQMEAIAEKLGVHPVWGKRNASLYDISTYGSFAAEVMTRPPRSRDFADAARLLIERARDELDGVYSVIDDEGAVGEVRHIVWSNIIVCPHCGKEFSFYEACVDLNPVIIRSQGFCPHCGGRVAPTANDFATEEVNDNLIGASVTRRKRVPAVIYGVTGKRKWRRPASAADISDAIARESAPYPQYCQPKAITWGDLHRSGYHTGITHLHHFYTRRNFRVMSLLWSKTFDFDGAVGDALRLLLLSYNASHSTLMTRVVAKRNSKDLILTSSQSGVLYISNLPVEKNILRGINRKFESFVKAFDYVNHCTGHVTVHNQSSVRLDEQSEGIDYVFTDPPFGDFIPYSEVNQLNELWLGHVTDKGDEAIISDSQGKGVGDYGLTLTRVFSEIQRVLKPHSMATLVFHSSKAEVWNAFRHAIEAAQLEVITTSTLDKVQDSFKQVVSRGSVKNDSLVLVGRSWDLDGFSSEQHVMTQGQDTDDPRKAYSDYINRRLEANADIELDAIDAYRLFGDEG